MSAIESIELRLACEIRSGGTPSKANPHYWRGDTPWVSPKDMKSSTISDSSDHITGEALECSAASLAPAGSVLVVVRSGVLIHSFPVAAITRAMSFNQDVKALSARKDSGLSPEYLFWFLRAKADQVVAHGVKKGATVHSLKAGYLESLRIPVRSLDQQRELTDRLQRAEGILRLRREAQRKAAELIPALFLDRFGDPASNPKHWPVAPLSEVAAVMSGATKGRRIDSADAIEMPYMRVANVKDGYLDLGEIKTITIRADELARLSLERGDLLMTEGGDPDKLGRAAIWTGAIAPCVHQNHIFKVRADRTKAIPEYLRSLAGSAYGKAYFLRVAKKTTGIASINKTQLSAFPVLLPPLAEQAAFARDVEAVESIIALHVQAEGKAQATFNALLHRCFSPESTHVST